MSSSISCDCKCFHGTTLTLFHGRIQLGDPDGQPVDPGLEVRASSRDALGIAEQVAEDLLGVTRERRQLPDDVRQRPVRDALELIGNLKNR